ncbi:MAG: VWA domain-containing protein [Burkholderiales bacterium]|nr:VWA domain-containing protein [Burkholderiales bacterium]
MAHHLAENILHFARVLRAAGLPVGTDRALFAVRAVEAVGLARRDDVQAALSSVMLESHDQQAVFDAAFDAFWRDPNLLERLMLLSLPQTGEFDATPGDERPPRRVSDALQATRGNASPPPAPDNDRERPPDAAAGTHSAQERLRVTDFESMSAAEFTQARRLAERIELPLRPLISRRRSPAARGHVDLRSSLRTMARQPDAPRLAFGQRQQRRPPLVMLIDISGSMERYSRAFLHFAHGLSRRHRDTRTFVFGTRLTDISRCLRHRDPDQALALAGQAARDWQGGTLIAASLAQFNRQWARQVLTRNASLMLVTDGLDRNEAGALGPAAATLARWAREIIWLNPLLRYAGFEPKASGIRALLPHVSMMIPVHDLRSLADIANAIERQRAVGYHGARKTPGTAGHATPTRTNAT